MDLGLADASTSSRAAASGLGLATAAALVAEGARVVLVARASDTLDAAVSALGASAVGLPADLVHADAATHAVDTALDAFGRLDGASSAWAARPPGTPSPPRTTSGARLRLRVPWLDQDGPRGLCRDRLVRTGRHRVAGLGAVHLRGGGVHRPDDQQRPATRLGDAGQGSGRRGRALGDPRQRTAARAHRHRPPRRPGRGQRRRGASRAPASAAHPAAALWRAREFGRMAAFLLSPAASYVTGTLIAVDGGVTRQP